MAPALKKFLGEQGIPVNMLLSPHQEASHHSPGIDRQGGPILPERIRRQQRINHLASRVCFVSNPGGSQGPK